MADCHTRLPELSLRSVCCLNHISYLPEVSNVNAVHRSLFQMCCFFFHCHEEKQQELGFQQSHLSYSGAGHLEIVLWRLSFVCDLTVLLDVKCVINGQDIVSQWLKIPSTGALSTLLFLNV